VSDYIDHEILSIGTEKQIIELNKMIVSLRTQVAELQKELDAKEKLPVPKSIVQQIVEMEAIIRKQQADLEYYKKHVPVQVIINKENKETPTRKGGIPR
jgi:uncharacterized coiled-coil protein SlyX